MAHGTAPQLAQEQRKDQGTDLSSAELAVPNSPEAETATSVSQEQPLQSPGTVQSNSLEQASLASTYDNQLKAKKKKALDHQTPDSKIKTKTETGSDIDHKGVDKKKSKTSKQNPEKAFVPNDPGNIIDRLVTHIANLIKRLEQWLIKKLAGPDPKKKVVLAKKPEDEKADAFEGRLRKKRKKSSSLP